VPVGEVPDEGAILNATQLFTSMQMPIYEGLVPPADERHRMQWLLDRWAE